jgi:LmbE family N-acetylglucosaminyl deacetylase
MATDPPPVHTLVLSPHFDDAVFSCGGMIRRLTTGGRRVVVVNVCAAPPAGPLSPYAATLHRRWGAAAGAERATAPAMVAHRRTEDEAALALLGAEGVYLEVPDCIYRMGPDGRWLYQGDDAIFGAVVPGDEATAAVVGAALSRLAAVYRRTRLLAPLSAGHHVDHQLVRQAAEQLAAARGLGLRYYEDMPYAADDRAVAQALGDAAAWRPRVVRITPEHLAAKVAAMAAYASQISSFWPDEAAMADEIQSLARRRGGGRWPAERLWEHDGAAFSSP